jgi:alkaline phosphatase D
MSTTRRNFATTVAATTAAVIAGPRAFAQTATVFRHGVASGDPLSTRVVIWTRVSPIVNEDVIPVEWTVALDPGFSRIYQRGLTYTNVAFDYTVKVDVARLNPDTTYYYQFTVRGVSSPIGRARTLPVGDISRARFAVASCSNFAFGFFNGYRLIANRADLNFVLHLGDYIYEYAEGQFGAGAALGRTPSPNREIVSLADYRERYAQYRADPDLQECHRQHTFITVWDDHESTNDSWLSGAQNHQPATEGDWTIRRATAAVAYYEWMPIRENYYENGEIYRNFRVGNLFDLIMLDSRLAGRDQQVAANSPLVLDPNRTLLGFEQEEWFYRQLLSSRTRGSRWRMVGQQTMMSQLFNTDGTPFNPDQWDGYIANRNRLLTQLATNNIGNVVVLTGDIHSSWGNEISANPFTATPYVPQAVEFVTPGITSPAFENPAEAAGAQQLIAATHPHVKYVDLNRRGYMLVDLTRDQVQAEWYHVRTLTERQATEDSGRVLRSAAGTNRLVAGTASVPISGPAPAPTV